MLSKTRGAYIGILAAAGAVVAGELVARIISRGPGPVVAVANRVIELAPTAMVDFGKEVFGTADKPALIIGTLSILLVVAIGIGLVSLRRRAIAAAGLGLFGVVGLLAIGVDPLGVWWVAVVVTLAELAVGWGLLWWLTSAARDSAVDRDDSSRRSFLKVAGIATAVVVAGGIGTVLLRSRSAVESIRASITLPVANGAAALKERVRAAASTPIAKIAGMVPYTTPNKDFYRIDTAIVAPKVDPSSWSLTINGMVEREMTYSYQDLLDRATTIENITMVCVSNPVGGPLVGNATWQGVPLKDLLDEAGVKSGADQISGKSVDGWAGGFPTEVLDDGRPVLVAIGMNGQPLPVEHGFPARLVVAGLYGYVSATKWLTEITLTTFKDFESYWVPRGWDAMGPVKTMSRIDTPSSGDVVSPGEVPIAGTAWNTGNGISKVEVNVDNDGWVEAELSEQLNEHTWVQWVARTQIDRGNHTVRVRAYDGDGQMQPTEIAAPKPNGAQGMQSVIFNAR